LYKAHRTTPRMVIKEGHEASRAVYFRHMASAKFCVAAAGFGFSTRAYEAACAGCIPLVMQDGIEQAFEDLLPWPLFSMRTNDSLGAIATLPSVLDAVPDASVETMRRVLRCVWPRFLWLRHDDGAQTPLPNPSALLRFDAFESIMWTLRKRLRADIGWPSDWEDGCRAVEQYFAQRPPGVHGAWGPWKNHQPAAAAAA